MYSRTGRRGEVSRRPRGPWFPSDGAGDPMLSCVVVDPVLFTVCPAQDSPHKVDIGLGSLIVSSLAVWPLWRALDDRWEGDSLGSPSSAAHLPNDLAWMGGSGGSLRPAVSTAESPAPGTRLGPYTVPKKGWWVEAVSSLSPETLGVPSTSGLGLLILELIGECPQPPAAGAPPLRSPFLGNTGSRLGPHRCLPAG